MKLAPLLALALAFPCAGQKVSPAVPPPAPVSLKSFEADFIEAYWRLHPEEAISAGFYKYADRLTVPDPAGRKRELAFAREWLGRLQAQEAKPLGAKDRIDLALIRGRLEASCWQINDFRAYEWRPSSHNVAHAFGLLLGTGYAPLEERLRTVSRRLEQVPAYYAAAWAGLRNPTLEHTELGIRQNRGALGVFGEGFRAQVEGSALAPAEKTRILALADQARAAIQGYIDHLETLDQGLKAQGGRSFRIGRELYEKSFATSIQADCTAGELYQRALADKEKLHVRMDELASGLWPSLFGAEPLPADRLDRIGRVVARLSEHHVAADQFVAEVKRQIPVLERWVTDHKLVELDPAKPLVVRETPEYMRGVAGASISAPGPYDPQANTYYNVTPVEGTPANQESYLREYNDYILQVLNIHEAVPGHYVQLLHANKSPSLVKALFGNGAMVEGWAVYAERMMLESGYGGNTPEMWLMYSKWNLRVVCNTILDYGVHVLGMTEDEVRRLLTKEAFQEAAEADEKWHRAQVTSVQLTSYYAGYSAIRDLREQLKARRKERFDLKAFHEELLGYGSAPVKFLRQLMLDQAVR